ncbi:anillin-like [Protopterus annectens]|uniref:anillin-like n=1 Tax=Protopterus annectens TaxID=7888 RepID=UPI001CFC36A9|nr:anillin-like [Protopterus annectens]
MSPPQLQKQVSSPPKLSVLTAQPETPTRGKSRFANLAATIGSWEDDLCHPSIKKNNAQEQPGTTCLSKLSAARATSVNASSSSVKQDLFSSHKPVEASLNKPETSVTKVTSDPTAQSSRVISPSPKKALGLKPQLLLESSKVIAKATVSSPHKPAVSEAQTAKAAASQPSQVRELTRGTDIKLQPNNKNTTPGGTAVKSFLDRFEERSQERILHSPFSASSGQRTPVVTPATKAIQERLLKQNEVSSTAYLTQQKKQEREKELASISKRFEKGSKWNMSGKECTEMEPLETKQEVHVMEKTCSEQSLSDKSVIQAGCTSPGTAKLNVKEPESSFGKSLHSQPSDASTNVKEMSMKSSHVNSSPLKKVTFDLEEQKSSALLSEKSGEKNGRSKEVHGVEMSVDDEDEANSSAVIDNLFDGMDGEEKVEEELKRSSAESTRDVIGGDEEVEEYYEEDELNISSMSLLTPLVTTVAVRSPEIAAALRDTDVKSSAESPKPSRFQRACIPKSNSSDSLDTVPDDHHLLYSIDVYRSQRFRNTEHPPVKQVIVRKEDVASKLEGSHTASPGLHNIKQKMKVLNNEVNLQQTVIHQASQALNCCTDEEHGKGSQEEAEAERLLLFATEKRLALLTELNKLKGEELPGQKKMKNGGSTANGSHPSRGSITLSEVRLPLKADFICTAARKPDVANYYFFVMFRAGAENIVATPLTSTQSSLNGDALSFSTTFTLENVLSDFEIDVEVYSLVQKRDCTAADKKKKANKSKTITPKRLLTSITKTNLHIPVLTSPGGPNAVRTSSFALVGSYKFTLASVGQSKFTLDKVPFLSPLEGHILLKIQCQVNSFVEEKGFLTMFEDVSGFGAWHRRWCVLSGYCISYWTYPDDEKRKNPINRINLANCTSQKIEPANREFCARPNTFELVTVRPQQEDDKETLVSQCRNTLCVTKNWFSADTKEERNLWMAKLNQVLVDLRMWQPDACYKPIKKH